MRVRLLNNGGYDGFEGVTFPVEVESSQSTNAYFVNVSVESLKGFGFKPPKGMCFRYLTFVLDDECELIE